MKKSEVFKILRDLEIQDRGIDIFGDVPEDVLKEAERDIKQFSDGYITCLNEVKKEILKLKED